MKKQFVDLSFAFRSGGWKNYADLRVEYWDWDTMPYGNLDAPEWTPSGGIKTSEKGGECFSGLIVRA